MDNQEKFQLIEKTIKAVQNNVSTDRLIQDCADKLSLSFKEVQNILVEFDSNLLSR